MKTFSGHWPFYDGNSPIPGEFPSQRSVTRSFDVIFYLRLNKRLIKEWIPGEFPSQRPVTRSFDAIFYLRLNKRLIKQWRRRWFETPSHPLWRHCNEFLRYERGTLWDGHPNGFQYKNWTQNCVFVEVFSVSLSLHCDTLAQQWHNHYGGGGCSWT